MDTAKSREYSTKAISQNAALAEVLREKEEVVGMRGNSSIAEIHLSNWTIVKSAGFTTPALEERANSVADKLVSGFTPIHFGIVGLVLWGIFFALSNTKQRRKRVGSYYQSYKPSSLIMGVLRMFPGGSWIIGGQVGKAFVAVSVVMLLGMPLCHGQERVR